MLNEAFLFCFAELRAELSSLKAHMETQAKELNLRNHQIEELEEKEKTANESVSYTYCRYLYT